MKIQAEYIWIDGQAEKPQPRNLDKMAELRSKTKIVDVEQALRALDGDISALPKWGFDGSSTNQAPGNKSDCALWPVMVCMDPTRPDTGGILVLCEVMNADGTPHESNTRHRLATKLAKKYEAAKMQLGFEQEYTLFSRNGKPLAWEMLGIDVIDRMPGQGRYYTGVGADRIFGRKLMELHTQACLDAELAIAGTNWEVMPGQAEYQIGPLPALQCADQLWLSRWLIQRLGEDLGIVVYFHPKPMGKEADWNGAGMHTNFSTAATMDKETGWSAIEEACRRLEKCHKQHLDVYGTDNDLRLSGNHETCKIDDFRWGISDRGASVRIPMGTANDKYGYLEDRRPAANADPYLVATALYETICGDGFKG